MSINIKMFYGKLSVLITTNCSLYYDTLGVLCKIKPIHIMKKSILWLCKQTLAKLIQNMQSDFLTETTNVGGIFFNKSNQHIGHYFTWI